MRTEVYGSSSQEVKSKKSINNLTTMKTKSNKDLNKTDTNILSKGQERRIQRLSNEKVNNKKLMIIRPQRNRENKKGLNNAKTQMF